MTTLTTAQVLRHAADNVEAGRELLAGLEGRSTVYRDKGWESAVSWHHSVLVKGEQEFRLAPRTITYTITHPEPLRVAPEVGTLVYIVGLAGDISGTRWEDGAIQLAALARGNIFATREDAYAADAARLEAYKGAT